MDESIPTLEAFHSQMSSTTQRIRGQLDELHNLAIEETEVFPTLPSLADSLDRLDTVQKEALLQELMHWADKRGMFYQRQGKGELVKIETSSEFFLNSIGVELNQIENNVSKWFKRLSSILESVTSLHMKFQPFFSKIATLAQMLGDNGFPDFRLGAVPSNHGTASDTDDLIQQWRLQQAEMMNVILHLRELLTESQAEYRELSAIHQQAMESLALIQADVERIKGELGIQQELVNKFTAVENARRERLAARIIQGGDRFEVKKTIPPRSRKSFVNASNPPAKRELSVSASSFSVDPRKRKVKEIGIETDVVAFVGISTNTVVIETRDSGTDAAALANPRDAPAVPKSTVATDPIVPDTKAGREERGTDPESLSQIEPSPQNRHRESAQGIAQGRSPERLPQIDRGRDSGRLPQIEAIPQDRNQEKGQGIDRGSDSDRLPQIEAIPHERNREKGQGIDRGRDPEHQQQIETKRVTVIEPPQAAPASPNRAESGEPMASAAPQTTTAVTSDQMTNTDPERRPRKANASVQADLLPPPAEVFIQRPKRPVPRKVAPPSVPESQGVKDAPGPEASRREPGAPELPPPEPPASELRFAEVQPPGGATPPASPRRKRISRGSSARDIQPVVPDPPPSPLFTMHSTQFSRSVPRAGSQRHTNWERYGNWPGSRIVPLVTTRPAQGWPRLARPCAGD
jgi:hypothetical protein